MLKDANMELSRPLDEKNPFTIEVKCNVCNKTEEIGFKRMKEMESIFCKRCKSEEEFLNNLKEVYGVNPYTLLEPYSGNKIKMKVRCNDCGYEFEITPSQMLSTHNYPAGIHPCRKCTDIRFKVGELENFYREEEYHFGEIKHKVVDEKKFSGMTENKPCEVECLSCGERFNAVPLELVTSKDWYCCKCHIVAINSLAPSKPKTTVEIISADEEIDESTITTVSKVSAFKDIVQEVEKAQVKKSIDEVRSFLYANYSDIIIENADDVISNRILQFYIPKEKVAIIYCDLMEHCEKAVGKTLHSSMYKECDALGIKIIHIFEDEWLVKKELVKDKIKHILNINHAPKVYARTCKIKEISSEEKNDFLEKNHVQGKDSSTYKLGLFFDDKLVSVLTFGKRRVCMGTKKTFDGEFELIRFASTNDKIVIGGFSKLLKYFVDTYKPKIITTFADLRWSTGKLYKTNKFVLDHYSDANYWYFKDSDREHRIHRFNFRKQNLPAKFPTFYSNDKTEVEIMYLAGYNRIMDCGNMMFTMDFRTPSEKKEWDDALKVDKQERQDKKKVSEETEC